VNAPPQEGGGARVPQAQGTTGDLADFFNKDRIPGTERPKTADTPVGHVKPLVVKGYDPNFLDTAPAHAQAQGHDGQDDGSRAHGAQAGGAYAVNQNGVIDQADHSKAGEEAALDAKDRENVAKIQKDLGPEGQETDGREVRCGPLLNYRRMEGDRWFGSVLVVVRGGRVTQPDWVPELKLSQVPLGGGVDGQAGEKQAQSEVNTVRGVLLYADLRTRFWRFSMDLQMQEEESHWAYEIPGLRFTSEGKTDRQHFYVPSVRESMRIMFHSCNGFSVGTDEEAWSGAALWNDVQRVHRERPFHVM
jgi:hypothetical protein